MRTCRCHKQLSNPIDISLRSIHQDRKKNRLLNIDERCKIRYFFLSDYLIKHWIKPFYLVSCLLRILRLRHFLFCRPWNKGDSLVPGNICVLNFDGASEKESKLKTKFKHIYILCTKTWFQAKNHGYYLENKIFVKVNLLIS